MSNTIHDDQDQRTSDPSGASDNKSLNESDKAEEIRDLERQFDAPAIKDEDRNTNKTDLWRPESSVSTPGSRVQRFTGIIRNNPKKSTGAALGVFGAGILSAFILNMIGPLQFIHLSESLKEMHFSDSETTSNNRTRRLVQYIKTRDTSKTRLGAVGNTIADKVETNMGKNGWYISHNTASGRYKGFTYKSTNKQELSDMKRSLEAEGVKGITIEGDSLKIDPGKGFFSNNYDRKVVSLIHNNTEQGKILGAMRAKRLLFVRYGIGWNPLTTLDSKITGSVTEKLQKYKEDRKAARKTKANANLTINPDKTAGDDATDAEKKAAQDSADNSRGTNDLVNDIQQDASSDNDGGQKTSKFGAKIGKAAGVAGMASFLCIAKNLANGADSSRQLAVMSPMMTMAAEYIALGEKVKAGENIDAEILEIPNEEINPEGGSSWSGSNIFVAQQGVEKEGAKLPTELDPNPSNNVVGEFLNNIPGLEGTCKVVESTLFQVITLPLAIATPITSAVTMGTMPFIINGLETLFSKDPIEFTQQYYGAVFGEGLAVGTHFLAAGANGASAGWAMTDTQAATLNNAYLEQKAIDNKQRSIADKYLNPYKYDTPVAKLIDNNANKNPSTVVAKIPSKIISSLPSIFSKKARAASTEIEYSKLYYGMHKVGFPLEILNEVEDPYKNADEAYDILKGPRGNELKDRLKKCNNIDVSFDNNVLDYKVEKDSVMGNYETLPAECKDTKDVDFNKIRISVLDTQQMDAYACYEARYEESCSKMTNQSTTETVGQDQEGTPIDSRFGPFVFPIQATQEEIKKGGWCWDKKDVTCHGTESYNYYASDIMIKEGVPILSAIDGKVVKVIQDADNKDKSAKETQITLKANDCDDTGTKLTCIGEGTVFWYGHLKPNSATVKVGDSVKAGQQIALSGNAQAGDGVAHLHFDASDRKNKFRQSCSRDNTGACQAAGFINIQPELYKAFNNIGKDGDVFTNNWVWPLAKNLKAGNCWNVLVNGKYHAGMDINTDNISTSNPAVAAHDGTVVKTGSDAKAGNYITIKSTDNVYYSYEHLSKILVTNNQTVKANDPVGIVGKTGNVSASSAGHLHFVTSKSNTLGSYSETPQQNTEDPMTYLPNNAPNGYKCIK